MQTTFKNIADFKDQMSADPQLQDAFTKDPVAAASSIAECPLDSDVWIYRIVVFSLGLVIILIIIGVIILMGFKRIENDTTVPTILTAIGSAAIGALGGLLAPSPKQKSN